MEQSARLHLAVKIREDIATLQSRLGDLERSAQTVQLDQQAVGRLSRMDSLANQGIAINALDKAKSRLARLERALARIDDEDFGSCIECGELIAEKRLLAMPETVFCVSCAK